MQLCSVVLDRSFGTIAINSIGWLLKFSPEWFCAGTHSVAPAFLRNPVVFPSAKVSRKCASLSQTTSLGVTWCMGVFSCGSSRIRSTRIDSFSNSILKWAGPLGNSSWLKAKNGNPNTVTTNMSIAFMLSAVALEVDFKSSEISLCPK
jgi:hypothetical protein